MFRHHGRPSTNASRGPETGDPTSGGEARHDPTLDADARPSGARTRGSAPIWGFDGGLRMPTDPTALSHTDPRDDEAPPISAAEPTLLSEDEPRSADFAAASVETPTSFPDYDTAMRYFVSEQNLSLLDAAEAIESWQSQGGTFTDQEYLWRVNNSSLIQAARASSATRSDRGAGSQGFTLVFSVDPERFGEVMASMPPQLRSRITGLELAVHHHDPRDDNE